MSYFSTGLDRNTRLTSILFSALISMLALSLMAGGALANTFTLDLTSPDGGETWSGTQSIIWDSNCTSGDFVDIKYTSGGSPQLIKSYVDCSAKTYSWDTETVSSGSNYQIIIYDASDYGTNDNSYAFTVDNEPPTASISDVSGSWVTSDDIDLGCSDTLSGCVSEKWYYFDSDSTCSASKSDYTSSTISDTITVDTSHNDYLCLWVEDEAGNSDTEVSSQLMVDAESPTTTDNAPSEWQNSDVTVTLTESDPVPSSDLSWTRYCTNTDDSCDPASGTNYTDSVPISSEGTTYFRYASMDNAGNTQSIVSRAIQIDKTVPSVSIDSPPSGQVFKTDFGISAIVSDDLDSSPICTYRFDSESETGISCTGGTISISGIPDDGHHDLYLTATDHADNSESDSVDVIIDTDYTLTVCASDCDFTSIQDAVDVATAGDTISVCGETFTESVTVNKEISVIGVGTSTVIDPATDDDGITVTTDNVILKDFKVTTENSGTDPNIAVSIREADNVELNGLFIETTGNKAMGIWIGGSSNGISPSHNLKIVKTQVTINGEATGIYAAHSSPAHTGWTIGGSSSDSNTVTANNGNPVELYDVSGSEVSYNTLTTSASGGSNVIWSSELSDLSNLDFKNNTVSYSGGSQVAFITDFISYLGLDPDTTDTTISSVAISGNTFSSWGSRALRLGDAAGISGTTVTGVAVNSNTFDMTSDTEVIGGTAAASATGSGNTFNVDLPAEIQDAIDSAFNGDTINMAAKTFAERLNLQSKTLTLQGAGAGSTTVDASSLSGYAIHNFGNSSSLKGFTLLGTTDSYGFKVSHVSDITLENIKVDDSCRTGIDLNTIDGATLNNIKVTDTDYGFGLMILDSNDISVTDVTTSGNAWGGVSVQTLNSVSDNITFLGTFAASETVHLLLEKDPSNYSDITNVGIPSKFGYIVYTFREGDNYKQWFYFETLSEAETFAGDVASSPSPTYRDTLIYDIAEKNYYVIEGLLIQDAIDAASDGDTVNVAVGTYVEQLLISKSIILHGESGAVISSPDARNTYTFDESSKTWEPIIFAYGGTMTESDVSGPDVIDVDIIGLEVDGEDKVPSSDRYAGILLRNVDGVISDNVVREMLVDGKETFCIIAYGDSELNISYNHVTGYSRGGIGANGDIGTAPDPVVQIHDNVVTGPGLGVSVTWAPNGIQVGWGATGEVMKNNVTGNGWPGTEWSGSGILVAGSSNVDVHDNTLYQNEVAIAVAGYEDWQDAPANSNLIRENEVYNNEYGISVEAKSTNTNVSYNDVYENTEVGIGIYGYDLSLETSEPTGTMVNHNWVYDNAFGLESADVSETVDAEINWWGDPTGPGNAASNSRGLGNNVSDNVDFIPWAYNTNFDVDTTDPTTEITDPNASSWQNETFAVSVDDADSEFGLYYCQYRVSSDKNGDGDFEDTGEVTRDWTDRVCNSDQMITVGASEDCQTQGSDRCRVQVRAVDKGGNNNWNTPYNEMTRKFSIDWIPPETTDDAPSGWQSSDVTVNLTATDTYSGVSGTGTKYCVYQAGTCTSFTSGTSVLVSTEGTNYVRYYSSDVAGNEETVKSETVMLDKSPPVISAVTGDLDLVVNTEVNIWAEVSDAGSEVDQVKVLVWAEGTYNEIVMEDYNATTGRYEATGPDAPEPMEVIYAIEAVDAIGNSVQSDNYTITFQDFIITFHDDWNLFSVPTELNDSLATSALGMGPDDVIYEYDSDNGWYIPEDGQLKPLHGYYVKFASGGKEVSFNWLMSEMPVVMPPERDLIAGWQLIGSSPEKGETSILADDALDVVEGKYTRLQNESGSTFTTTGDLFGADVFLGLGKGYWLLMSDAGTIYGYPY